MSTFKANNSEYTTSKFTIGKTVYAVTVVSGQINHVTVRKETANPFGALGTDFKDFDAAVSHYKNRSIKLELTKIELGI